MDLIPIPVIVALVLIGVLGAVLRPLVLRLLCWVLALPPLAFGGLALLQGGIAEPFSGRQLLTFCALSFTPAIGCTIGEVVQFRRRRRRGRDEASARIDRT